MSTAIEFNNISKQYRLGLVSSGTIRDDLKRWWTMSVRHKEDPFLKIGETNDRSSKGMSDYVWALKDIDFKVEQGDVVGIIGKNGAGKSTLLKILSKITAPTTGTIKAKGRIGSLLEVGTGFHPEMTGRENIYLNGAILGMSKQEIDRKLDEIVDFSGCERYIDTPVKRYSSGMMVRLGFAVAAHLDPEILVVDEVLAVGDAEFQKKAIGKMKDVSQGEGRTVLFVSHNMGAIRNLCNNGIVLKNGMIDYMGSASECVDYYINCDICDLETIWNRPIKSNCCFQMYHAEISNNNDEPKENFSCDEDIHLNLSFDKTENIPGLSGYLQISKTDGSVALVSDSNDLELNKLEKLPLGKSSLTITIPKRTLAPGSYSIYLNFTSDQNISGFQVDGPYNVCLFSVYDDATRRGNARGGYFSTLLDWNVK